MLSGVTPVLRCGLCSDSHARAGGCHCPAKASLDVMVTQDFQSSHHGLSFGINGTAWRYPGKRLSTPPPCCLHCSCSASTQRRHITYLHRTVVGRRPCSASPARLELLSWHVQKALLVWMHSRRHCLKSSRGQMPESPAAVVPTELLLRSSEFWALTSTGETQAGLQCTGKLPRESLLLSQLC